MAQELGRIERPSLEPFRGKRKLLLVPLVYEPPTQEEDGVTILQRYWDQMQTQVASLESKLGDIKHVYHETIPKGSEEGLKLLETVDQRSYKFVQTKCQAGATLEATEDEELLVETLDLQRCLMLPFASDKVVLQLQDWFTDSSRKRYEHVSKQIDETLGEDQVGLLLINERHQVQFPPDVEVFFVAPPALEEFRRWLQDWLAQQRKRDTASELRKDLPE